MNKIELNSIKLIGIVMGIWLMTGTAFFYLFYPTDLFPMLHTTLSLYLFIFVGVIFYFFTKKAFSDLLELEPKKKGKKKD